MTTRLFHAIVVCGTVLGTVPVGCGGEAADGDAVADGFTSEAGTLDAGSENRCQTADAGCGEHCSALPDGGCLDPCFVHTQTCSPDCLLLDGSCGWPPTK